MNPEKVSLYYRDGGSDKVYHAQLEGPDGNALWVVNFQYGRRGNALQTGTKTNAPLPYEAAKKIYDRLVAEKKAKGYTEGEDGTPYQGNVEKVTSGMVPQLLNIIDEDRVKEVGADDMWMMEEKKDGVRLMVRKATSPEGVVTVTGSNRKGVVVPLPTNLEEKLKALPGNYIIDGELVGEQYFVFDCLEANGVNYRELGALDRFQRMRNLFGNYRWQYFPVQPVDAALDTNGKRQMYINLLNAKAEGVVFKHKNMPYVPGRPNSGGNQLKYKFTQSATCYVRAINNKRSVEIGMRQGTDFISVGNVTIPKNFDIPEEGQLVEVRYLYAYPGGSLYQPVYLGVRNDIQGGADEVTTLKYKQGTVLTDEEDAA